MAKGNQTIQNNIEQEINPLRLLKNE